MALNLYVLVALTIVKLTVGFHALNKQFYDFIKKQEKIPLDKICKISTGMDPAGMTLHSIQTKLKMKMI